jgi:alpha-ketoglutarate-dependent taurine dioxygenase
MDMPSETKFETLDLTARIGTEIKLGLPALLSGRHAAELRDILEQRGVIVFRELSPTPEQQLAIARTMGELVQQGDEGLFPISLDRKRFGHSADYLRGSLYWHIDGASDEFPTRASMLVARVLAPAGGETEFCNTYAAWDDLPEAQKRRIEKLRVVHSMETSQRFVTPEPTVEELRRWQAYGTRIHPLVWTHRSGRKSLVLGCTASRIQGMSLEEGRMLLCELQEWATQPKFVYRHEWKLGDTLMWDNTGTMHRARPYAPDSGRYMTRVTLVGEEPLAA